MATPSDSDAGSPAPGAPTSPVHFSFWTEKLPGEGEDAPPLLIVGAERSVLGVFDGMGGAGGTSYETPAGRHSGAWFASRLVQDVVAGHLLELVDGSQGLDGERVADLLADRIRSALSHRLTELGTHPSAIRSKLLRALPTTLAVAYVVANVPDAGCYLCHALWAGDSRVYVLRPEEGVQQVSTDDLRSQGDAMANLMDDSVMSNCVSADTDFHINYRRVELQAPFVVLCASDGCFGYLPTPMHFEHLVLSTLIEASNQDAWREALRARVSAVTGDDASLALMAVGGGVEDLRDIFRSRLELVTTRYVEPLDELDRQEKATQDQAAELRQRRLALRTELWAGYKPCYEGLFAPPAPKDDQEKV